MIQFSETWATYSSRFIQLLWLILIIFVSQVTQKRITRLKIFKQSALQIYFRFAVVEGSITE